MRHPSEVTKSLITNLRVTGSTISASHGYPMTGQQIQPAFYILDRSLDAVAGGSVFIDESTKEQFLFLEAVEIRGYFLATLLPLSQVPEIEVEE